MWLLVTVASNHKSGDNQLLTILLLSIFPTAQMGNCRRYPVRHCFAPPYYVGSLEPLASFDHLLLVLSAVRNLYEQWRPVNFCFRVAAQLIKKARVSALGEEPVLCW